jgi:hypothetical protein
MDGAQTPIHSLATPPTADVFERDYVHRSRPVLIRGALGGWARRGGAAIFMEHARSCHPVCFV